MKNLEKYTKKQPGKYLRKDKVTSINITKDQWDYLKRNNVDFSRLIRDFLDSTINENNDKKEV